MWYLKSESGRIPGSTRFRKSGFSKDSPGYPVFSHIRPDSDFNPVTLVIRVGLANHKDCGRSYKFYLLSSQFFQQYNVSVTNLTLFVAMILRNLQFFKLRLRISPFSIILSNLKEHHISNSSTAKINANQWYIIEMINLSILRQSVGMYIC